MREEAGAPRPIRAVAPGDEAPRLGGLLGGERADRHALDARGQEASRPRAALADEWRGRGHRGRAGEDGQRRRHAQRIRQLRAVQRAAQRGVVAKLGIAQHRRHGDPAGAHLAQERERQVAISPGTARSPECGRAAAPRASATPPANTSSRPASTRGRRSTARPSPPPDNWRSCPACRSTAARRRPTGCPAWGSSCRRESARPRDRAPWRAGAATRARPPTAHR